jgi:flagellar hook-length control protein FliK
MLIALYRSMNIFTSSMPEINTDQIMTNRPAPSHHNNDNVGDSSFAKHVNDAERSVTRHEDKKEAYSTRKDDRLSKPDPKKSDNAVNREHSAIRPEGRQETEDTNKGQQVSRDNHSKEEGSTEARETEGKTDLAGNDVNGDVVEETDNSGNETGNDNPAIAEPVIPSFEQALLSEIALPNQGSEDIDGTLNHNEEEAPSDTDTIKPKISNVNTSDKGDPEIINSNTDNVVASIKQQGSTANDKGQTTNESKEPVIDSTLDEIASGELNSEDGQKDGVSEESGSDSKGFNKNAGFGKGNLEELSEEFDLDEDLKEKIKLAATRELPDKYAKKIEIDQSDRKTVQSLLNPVDPETLEELNKFKTLQDGMLSGNAQSQANSSRLNNAFKGVADTTLNSLESIHSNTTVSHAELAQNQAMTMAGGKAGAGLMNSNAARTAAFNEVLNQVVYVAKGKSKLGVTVNHEELGKLKINVTMEKGILNIHVNASEKVVREYLESNVQSIIESLSKDGISVGGFSVALKDHQDNQEKKFFMDSGLERQYENIPAKAVHSARGLVNVFA